MRINEQPSDYKSKGNLPQKATGTVKSRAQHFRDFSSLSLRRKETFFYVLSVCINEQPYDYKSKSNLQKRHRHRKKQSVWFFARQRTYKNLVL